MLLDRLEEAIRRAPQPGTPESRALFLAVEDFMDAVAAAQRDLRE